MRPKVWMLLLATACGCFVSATASASVTRSGMVLNYTASAGEENTVFFYTSGGDVYLFEQVDGTNWTAPTLSACSGGGGTGYIVCSSVDTVNIDLGDGDDRAYLRNTDSSVDTYYYDGVSGGAGNDEILCYTASSSGSNWSTEPLWIDAGTGDDTVDCDGADGGNMIYGGDGGDSIYSGSGADRLAGDETANEDSDDTDEDRIEAGGGEDTLYGQDDADQLYGDGGSDTIYGGDDGDFIEGGRGEDTIEGQDGNDQLNEESTASDSGADSYSGGEGSDTLEYDGRSTPTAISLDGTDNDGQVRDSSGFRAPESDNVGADIETFWTGSGNDSVDLAYAESASHTVHVGTGNDTISLFEEDGSQPVVADYAYCYGGDDTVTANFTDVVDSSCEDVVRNPSSVDPDPATTSTDSGADADGDTAVYLPSPDIEGTADTSATDVSSGSSSGSDQPPATDSSSSGETPAPTSAPLLTTSAFARIVKLSVTPRKLRAAGSSKSLRRAVRKLKATVEVNSPAVLTLRLQRKNSKGRYVTVKTVKHLKLKKKTKRRLARLFGSKKLRRQGTYRILATGKTTTGSTLKRKTSRSFRIKH